MKKTRVGRHFVDGWCELLLMLVNNHIQLTVCCCWGYRSGSPTAVQPGNHALCGSCPL